MIQEYQNGREILDGFEELSTLLDLFFLDDKINNDEALVKGSVMCELLGLFFDLAETSTNTMGTQLEELQKYKTAY